MFSYLNLELAHLVLGITILLSSIVTYRTIKVTQRAQQTRYMFGKFIKIIIKIACLDGNFQYIYPVLFLYLYMQIVNLEILTFMEYKLYKKY